MKRLKNFMCKDFGNQIAAFFIPFVVIISLVISMCCYYTFYKAFKEEKQKNTQVLINQIGIQFDSQFKSAKSLVSYMTLNQQIEKALKRYQGMDAADRYFLEEDLQGALNNIEISIDCVADIIISGKNGFLFNLPNSFGLKRENYEQEKEWIERFIDSDEIHFYYTTVHENDYYVETQNGVRRVVSMLLPIKYQRTYYGYIQADMDYEKLNATLYQVYSQQEMDVTIVNEDGIVLFDKEEEMLSQTMDTAIWEQLTEKSGSFTITQGEEKRLVVYQRLDVTDWVLVASISYSSMTTASDYVLRVIWFLILPFFVILSVAIAIGISSRLKKPLQELSERVGSIDIETFEYQEKDYGADVLNGLGERFEDSYAQIKELIDKVYIAEIRQKNAQCEILQNQITPHFMYNSLQLIKTEALIAGNGKIGEITTSFSNLLRYSLEKDRKWVEAEQEMENAEDYLNIYQNRFPQKFTYEIQMEEEIRKRLVLKLILQPLVENCIKHGFKDVTEGGRIILRGCFREEDIWFEIEDNGAGISEQRMEEIEKYLYQENGTRNHVGLINVHQRIVIEDGSGYGLVKIESAPGERTRFVLRIRGNRRV